MKGSGFIKEKSNKTNWNQESLTNKTKSESKNNKVNFIPETKHNWGDSAKVWQWNTEEPEDSIYRSQDRSE